MSGDSDNLDDEIDIKRAEYLLKRDEFELRREELRQKDKNDAKAWQRVIAAPLIIAVIAALLSGALEFVTERTKIVNSGENSKFAREHALLLEADNFDKKKRLERLCRFAYSNSFQHPDSVDILNDFKEQHPDCTAEGFEEAVDPVKVANAALQKCIDQAAIQTASCRAYDKSGFHSTPNASCSIELIAPDGQFFAKSQVTILDEFYRKLSGPSALDALKPVGNEAPIRKLSGQIACTNSVGTGRTCEARATVQLPSYPDACLPYLDKLATL